MLETNHTLTTATKKEPTRASKKNKQTNKQTKKNNNNKTHPFDKKCGNVLIGFSFYM